MAVSHNIEFSMRRKNLIYENGKIKFTTHDFIDGLIKAAEKYGITDKFHNTLIENFHHLSDEQIDKIFYISVKHKRFDVARKCASKGVSNLWYFFKNVYVDFLKQQDPHLLSALFDVCDSDERWNLIFRFLRINNDVARYKIAMESFCKYDGCHIDFYMPADKKYIKRNNDLFKHHAKLMLKYSSDSIPIKLEIKHP